MEEALNVVMATITEGLFSLLLAGLSVLLVQGFSFLKVKIGLVKNEKQQKLLNSVLSQLETNVYTAVKATELEVGAELREAVKDGKIDKNELIGLKDVVREKVLKGLQEDFINTATQGVGDVNGYIDDLIVTKLDEIKKELEGKI